MRAVALRRGTLLLLIVAAVGWVIVVLLRQPLPPSPPAPPAVFGAAMVPGTQGADPVNGSLWRSNTQVVCIRRSISGGRQAVLVNTDTGTQTPLTALRANALDSLPSGSSYPVRLSPDGRWLLWEESGGPFVAAALDGARVVRRTRVITGNAAPFAWTSDSRHWVEMTQASSDPNGVKLRRFSVDSPQPQVLPLNLPYFDAGFHLWVTPAGDAIMEQMEREDQLMDVPLTHRAAARPLPISFPPQTHGDEDALSPAGDRVAFLCQDSGRPEYVSPLVLLRRLLTGGRGMPSPSATTESLWISSFDAARGGFGPPHPVAESAFPSGDTPSFLHWTPDGRRVGFWYKDALWRTAPLN